MLLVQTGKLKLRLLPHSFHVENKRFQSGCDSAVTIVCKFQWPISGASQAFGLFQHILQQCAVKTMDMETEREILVPEIYLMKLRTKALIFSLEWTLFQEN